MNSTMNYIDALISETEIGNEPDDIRAAARKLEAIASLARQVRRGLTFTTDIGDFISAFGIDLEAIDAAATGAAIKADACAADIAIEQQLDDRMERELSSPFLTGRI